MSAQDCVNMQQFPQIKLRKLMKMDSSDARPELGERSVGGVLGRKQEDLTSDTETFSGARTVHDYYDSLRTSMVEHGQTVPIQVHQREHVREVALRAPVGVCPLPDAERRTVAGYPESRSRPGAVALT